MNFRVGIGYDIHSLTESNKLDFKLAGVTIPFDKRCVAHSDGDVAIHALIDALLGAAALGDIGTHFPDTDPAYKNADSATLLRYCVSLLESNGYKIENIDINIIAENPKLLPYIAQMRNKLSEIMQIEVDRISIKAKTNEQLDAIGRGEAIAAQAVAMIGSRFEI